MPFCYSERTPARVSTVRQHTGDLHASFLADFLGNCAIAFPICPLMRQKCAFRYFGPEVPANHAKGGVHFTWLRVRGIRDLRPYV